MEEMMNKILNIFLTFILTAFFATSTFAATKVVWWMESSADTDPTVQEMMCDAFNAEQDAQFGNQYEIHIQSDLNNEKFLSLYRDFELYCLRYDYGIYIKKKTANSYVPIYTLDITEQDKDFLANYSNRAIIEI